MEIRADDGNIYYFPDSCFRNVDDMTREELEHARNFVMFMETHLGHNYSHFIGIEETIGL